MAWSIATGVSAVFAHYRLMLQTVDDRPQRPVESLMAINARSWLVGIGGMFAGCLLFTIDLAIELVHLGPPQLHFWIECVEFTLIGPGLGLTCLLLAERIRTLREQARIQSQAERERRLLILGKMAASVAHEVRNPLHTLHLVMGELRLEQPALRDHALRPHIDDALERIDRAVDLVYRLARPDVEDDIAGDLVACLRDSAAALRLRLSGAPINFTDLPVQAAVRCSSSGLRIMIDNLLRNAVEAAGRDGTVQARVDAVANGWRLRITNPGTFSESSEPDVGLAPGSHKVIGLGLGLAITKHLVDGVRGRLSLTAENGTVTTDLFLPSWKDVPE